MILACWFHEVQLLCINSKSNSEFYWDEKSFQDLINLIPYMNELLQVASDILDRISSKLTTSWSLNLDKNFVGHTYITLYGTTCIALWLTRWSLGRWKHNSTAGLVAKKDIISVLGELFAVVWAQINMNLSQRMTDENSLSMPPLPQKQFMVAAFISRHCILCTMIIGLARFFSLIIWHFSSLLI